MSEPDRSLTLRRLAGALQIAVVLALVTFSTWQLYRGNLAAGFSVAPFLLVYYLFLTSRRRRP